MYVERMPPEMIRLHTRTAYTSAWFFPLTGHFLCSPLVHRVDVMGDRSLVVSKLYPASNPPTPYPRGVLGG